MELRKGAEEWHRRFQVLPPGEQPAAIVSVLADGRVPELVWRNELGGQTWRVGELYIKWSPDGAGLDLDQEVQRLGWLLGRPPVPEVLDSGHDGRGSWILTAALAGTSAVSARWRAAPEPAVRAIAEGLRRLHQLDTTGFPTQWESWATRRPPELGRPPAVGSLVVVHGDACAPNTLVQPDGGFAGIVDVGDLVLGDRWADLAVASMSLAWNFGHGWEPCFFDAYGTERDDSRITYFRRLWDAES